MSGYWPEAVLLVLAFFVVVPSIAVCIGYKAWKGYPRNFGRDMYWTAFATSGAASVALMVYAQRMQAELGSWLRLVQLGCGGLGVLLFGVACGCLIGIFAYRRGISEHPEK